MLVVVIQMRLLSRDVNLFSLTLVKINPFVINICAFTNGTAGVKIKDSRTENIIEIYTNQRCRIHPATYFNKNMSPFQNAWD